MSVVSQAPQRHGHDSRSHAPMKLRILQMFDRTKRSKKTLSLFSV